MTFQEYKAMFGVYTASLSIPVACFFCEWIYVILSTGKIKDVWCVGKLVHTMRAKLY